MYEHRKRELENAVLLSMMLEKKGYKVAISYRRSIRLFFMKADVILTPFLYDNDNTVELTFHPFSRYKKIINLQYEQVFSKKDEEALNNLPKETAKNAVHISWGKNTTERYKKNGIKPENIFEIGHVAMDLNMPKYKNAFLDRNSISKMFNIPSASKWLLFLSSFSCIGLTKTEFEKWKNQTLATEYDSKISYQTQPIILDYFKKCAESHPEIIIIYRPHPHESTCAELTDLSKKYKNFKIINNFSIRQWLLVSDYISTWTSTSLVDAFYAKKPCAIIRPIPFLYEYNQGIFNKQKNISSYSELEDFLNNPEHYCINSNPINEYYCNDFNACTFEKLCDVCIQVKNNKKYEYDYSAMIHTSPIRLLKIYVYKTLLSLAKFVNYSKITPEKYRNDVQDVYREMHKYKEEIKYYRKRFSGIIKNAET